MPGTRNVFMCTPSHRSRMTECAKLSEAHNVFLFHHGDVMRTLCRRLWWPGISSSSSESARKALCSPKCPQLACAAPLVTTEKGISSGWMIWKKRHPSGQINQEKAPFLQAVRLLQPRCSRAESQVNFSPDLCPFSQGPLGRPQCSQNQEVARPRGARKFQKLGVSKVLPGNQVKTRHSSLAGLDMQARLPSRRLQKPLIPQQF